MTDARSLSPEEIRQLLERRAAVLAKPPPQERSGETIEVLVTRIGGERYGVGVGHVVEVRPLEGLTPVPGVPAVWAGLVNLRGVLHPVIDGAAYLGVERDSAEERHVVVLASEAVTVGLMVDDVAGFRTVRVDEVEPPLGADALAHRKAVSGVTADLLLLLDVETVLGDPMLVVDEQAS